MIDRTEAKSSRREREPAPGTSTLPDWPLILSRGRFVLFAVTIIFFAVLGRNLIVPLFPPLALGSKILLETGLAVLLLAPLYFFFHLPFRSHYADHIKAHREVSSLSRETMRIMEGERRVLARELHDNFGQTLTALQFGIDILRHSLPAGKGELQEQCDQMQECISRLGDEMRGLCAHLHPSMLETRGIVSALEWHLQRLRDHGCGLELRLETAGLCDAPLSPELSITLYRLCEEGLSNVVRHAGATRAEVRLKCARDRIVMTIADDGCGFDPSEVTGIGIPGMRERSAALGGTLRIDSAKGRGTTVRAEIPVGQ